MIRAIVVDDEPAALERYAAYVGDYGKGFTVAAACRSAADAFAAALREKPDLLFADIRMPGEDGLSLLRRLRESGWTGLAVVISGYDDFAYAQAAIRLGAFDFILKPVFPEDMRAVLDRTFERLRPRRTRSSPADPRAGGEELPAPVRKVIAFIESRYDARFTLDEAARAAGVSTTWISSTFKRIYGCSPMEYARRYRTEKAAELLTGTDLPIKAIAEALAFPDLPTFSKLFRKISGVSPGAYRRTSRAERQ